MRDLVQVHADGSLDVKIDADTAAVAGLGFIEARTQVGGDEVRPEWNPENEEEKKDIRSCKYGAK